MKHTEKKKAWDDESDGGSNEDATAQEVKKEKNSQVTRYTRYRPVENLDHKYRPPELRENQFLHVFISFILNLYIVKVSGDHQMFSHMLSSYLCTFFYLSRSLSTPP